MADPTYVKEVIDANAIWKLAFYISEIINDNAPIGWHKYVFLAQCLASHYDMKEVTNGRP